nr:MAG TPA: hypothetical protein [Caudoviricetes sp.]DAQ68457.1 MAG TPA: hypothetical protein [Caudoviricetes sp.]DAU17092.1 MAG TPA: hypothetical protein [Caudoviricetes sp.]
MYLTHVAVYVYSLALYLNLLFHLFMVSYYYKVPVLY